jgi:predicted glycosyltransferase
MHRVMFYCQHCVGFGHLVRSSAIVRSLARDFSVLFVTGGPSVTGFELPSGVDVVRLPEIQTDAEFESLQVCDSALNLEETQALRKDLLISTFDSFRPDAVITELYPFGRKRFAFELIPLLERARRRKGPRPAIVSSVRDVLVTKKDDGRHETRVCKIINKFYHLVLVHGDERLQRLEETFPQVGDLHCPVAYTGYVVRPENRVNGSVRPQDDQPTIIVSAGGGKYPECHLLLESVIRAARVLADRIPHQFHIYAGPFIPATAYERLSALTPLTTNVVLDRFTPDLAAKLRLADLSVSMGGYNTIMDILCTGVRALILPVTSNEDTEQTVRAAKLQKLGVLELLRPDALAPEPLAAAILEALRRKPDTVALNLDGADNTALRLREFLQNRAGFVPPAQTRQDLAACLQSAAASDTN